MPARLGRLAKMDPATPAQQRFPTLPALLADMADHFGLDVALDFAEQHGGVRLTLPVRATAAHKLAGTLGVEMLAWLIAWHDARADGGDTSRNLDVPRGPAGQAAREALVRDLLAKGWSRNRVARELRLTVRGVSKITARLRAAEPSPQLDLFPSHSGGS